MEKIVKAFKVGGESNTFIGYMLDPVIEGIEFVEELKTFADEYFHEHLDEFDNVYTVFKFSNPSLSVIINPKKLFLITNPKEKILMIKNQIMKLS